MNENGDDKDSSEGGDPPNREFPRRRRIRKLSGPTAQAFGELVFKLYEVAAMQAPSDTKWKMLQAKLLAWRALYLP